MSSGNLYSDLILLRRHYANFRKDVMDAESIRPDRPGAYLRTLTNWRRVQAARAELDALSRSIKRLESDRWKVGGRKKP